MNHRCPPQVEQVLALAPIAGAVTLPVTDVRQAMLHWHALAQLCPPLGGQLTLAQLLHQALITMDTHAPPGFARRTAWAQGTPAATVGRKDDVAPRRKRNHDPIRTLDRALLPIQDKGHFGKLGTLPHGPGAPGNLQGLVPLAHQVTAQIGPVNMQRTQRQGLGMQIERDTVGDLGFGHIRRRNPHRRHQATIQIPQHMALVPVHQLRTALAPVAHLAILQADPAVGGDPVTQGRLAALTPHHILFTNLSRGGQWYQIEGETSAGETVTGWVYKDWINIAPEDEIRLQPNPEPLPVVVSEITTTIGDDWKQYWSGTVMNIGSKTAYDVQVEISLNGQVGDTETLADRGTAYVVSRNLEPGQAAKFTVQTSWVRDENVFYSYEVRWTER